MDGNQKATPPSKSDLILVEEPFTLTVLANRLSFTCSYCLVVSNEITSLRLLRCGKCKFVFYCGNDCQRKDWTQHKRECQRIRRFLPFMDENGIIRNIPDGLIDRGDQESMDQFPDAALRLVARMMDVWENPETKAYSIDGRTLDMLETHENEIQANPLTKQQFDQFCGLYEFYCTADERGRPNYNHRLLLKLYGICRSNIFCINDSKLETLACGIYVNLRRIRHSCNPNARIVFDGRKAKMIVQPDWNADGSLIEPTLNSYDQIYYSYIDNTLPRNERQRFLKEVYLIDCHCDLCDGDQLRNDIMEGLRCDATDGCCEGPVVWRPRDNHSQSITSEGQQESSITQNGQFKCSRCGNVYEDQANAEMILKLTRDVLDSSTTQHRLIHDPHWAKDVYANLACMQMPTLHSLNVYRLRTIKGSYETACRLGNWADAAAYGDETLDGYKHYLNENYDPEYALMAVNVAKAHINNFNPDRAMGLLQKYTPRLEYAFGIDSDQIRDAKELISICQLSDYVKKLNIGDEDDSTGGKEKQVCSKLNKWCEKSTTVDGRDDDGDGIEITEGKIV